MGASAWQYYVPFEPDIRQALARIRQEVFRAGQYYAPPGTGRPASIEDLLEMSGESGTHSILDVMDVAERPSPGVVAPLSQSELVGAFGSERPTRHDVERATAVIDAIRMRRGRWAGSYLVVYDGNSPREFFFFGYSGD
jgi:hypothetical protein